ncbi:fibrobacter succinogenes major paralogous domain-containing protein [Flavobacteriaceae bacterium]|nr:fibrobacter succinogenes major paralogous domain-containing protein [Flavobacteriaceae bacterium]
METKYGTVENAEMVTYRDGTTIPQVTDATEWRNLTTGAWSYYDNDPTKPRLYNWFAVMGIHDTDPNTPNKEFAPEGWHVPSDAEWTTLEEYLIASGYNYDGTTTGNKIGKAMASTTGWNSSTDVGAIGNDQSSNNNSNFNAFPEGLRNNNGWFDFEGLIAFFWSSTEGNADFAWYRTLPSSYSYLYRYSYSKQNGFSVRFVRD